MSSSTLPIPPTSGYTAIGLGVASVLSVVVKYKLVPPKYHAFVPYVSEPAREFATLTLTLVQELQRDGNRLHHEYVSPPLEQSEHVDYPDPQM